MEPQDPNPQPQPASGAGVRTWIHSVSWQRLLLVLVAAVCAVGVSWWLRGTPQNGHADNSAGHKEASRPSLLFRGWDKPAAALVLSGQQYGYLQPCGCSHPQFGGLSRRYNFVAALRQKGWPVVAVDLGDIADKSGSPQRKLKYATSMKALHQLGYAAVGLGKSEMAMPLLDALAEYTLNNPNPRVLAANLLNRGKDELFHGLIHDTCIIEQDALPSIGVIGLIGPSVQSKVNDPDAKFNDNNAQVIQRSLAQLRGKCALTVLLYQGTTEEAKAAAQYCAQLHRQNPALPRLDMILCLSEEAEPPATAVQAPGVSTLIFNIGHKGRYVGVVGAFRKAGGYELKYQLVPIGPEYETPAGQEAANPIMAMMTSYANEVKAGQYIIRYRTSPHPVQVAFPQARYVGSERCAGCHESAHTIWEKSLHAKAYETLVNVKHPPHRQWDGECVVCHVVGFTHPTGYSEALRASLINDGLRGAHQDEKISAEARKLEKLLPQFQHVGCESCHGPCSEHVQNPRQAAIHAVINPWKGRDGETEQEHARRMLKIDLFCQTCHDVDNDVHWDFQKKWPKIMHMTPKTEAANQVEPAPRPVPAPRPKVAPAPEGPVIPGAALGVPKAGSAVGLNVPGPYSGPTPFTNGFGGQVQVPSSYTGETMFGSQAQNPYGYNNSQSRQGYHNDSDNRRRFFGGGNRFFRRNRD